MHGYRTRKKVHVIYAAITINHTTNKLSCRTALNSNAAQITNYKGPSITYTVQISQGIKLLYTSARLAAML